MMKITVLSDNIGSGDLKGEWGLSFHIEYDGGRILLDTGGSGLFLKNAGLLGIDISAVDAAVLSHAHYDHSLGMADFFEANGKAPFYLSPEASEDCYSGRRFFGRYIGIPKGVLSRYSSRIRRPEGVTQILPGAFIVPHSTPGLEKTGRKARMYRKRSFFDCRVDDFSHEQTLVLKSPDGLVILNSCSHAGADVIVDEVKKAFPADTVSTYMGGLHLFRLSDREVEEVAGRIRNAGVTGLYTGHCTGERAYGILRQELGDCVHQFHCGMEIRIE
ncbi:MAG: MBL fold metallo-hydrolase [Bacteroidales bacterium]|nr:MBL fold metallo-hydrolase [Candidatus Cacconaster equifaecalis]